MKFSAIVPILHSADIIRSLTYYTEILGFENKWDWENPPTFGGVYKDGVQIFFCKDCQGNPGTWLSVFVDDVDEFYETIKAKGAKILSPPANMEWGVREMLVEDPDGHKIRFGHGVSSRERSATKMPETVKIIARIPTAKEIHHLASAVGWSSSIPMAELPLSAIVFVVIAENTLSGEVIGCAFLLGDHAGFYYIKNVLVLPDWQGKRVGTALMQELSGWLERNAPDNAIVALHTGENLAPFYKQFGFIPVFSMHRQIRRNEKRN